MSEQWQTGPGWPGGAPVPAPTPREAQRPLSRVTSVPGTPFGLVYPDVPRAVSGPALSSLIAGIGALFVTLVVGCLGPVGAGSGWGLQAAGPFALLSGLIGLAGAGLGLASLRQLRRARVQGSVPVTGRGLAIAGLSCGATAVFLTVLILLVVLAVQTA